MTFPASRLTAARAVAVLALIVGSSPASKGQSAAPRGKVALMNPADLKERALDEYKVDFDTSQGPFVMAVHRTWAPIAADHFYNLVKRGFYDGNRFFRVLPGFVAQWGISGDPEITKVWKNSYILDDEWGKHSNKRGTVAFVSPGLGRRGTVVFVSLDDNSRMDDDVVPFGEIVSGLNVFEKLYAGYGDTAPAGNGPERNRYYAEGSAYLDKEFPELDYIKTATIEMASTR